MKLLDFDDNELAAGSAAAATASASAEKLPLALAPLGINGNGASLLLFPNVNACLRTLVTAGGEDDFVNFQAVPSLPLAAASITT